ncbi:PP2C-domain-containing protein [Gonapodya prolifera JEL478]|uniref:PP2C-domain-containing protein n=1 Tax=Gonapodya prolifera (strain JEL478) TaxID=1344416 RepID=A0A139AS70_GONPJ|nr:PP2C-domain-containing protein [Gonapodya prolifera JEL478]|eukprot:KXS19598.1 PP2C-domain-containing protein [Gonapodya prolifera JEL478]
MDDPPPPIPTSTTLDFDDDAAVLSAAPAPGSSPGDTDRSDGPASAVDDGEDEVVVRAGFEVGFAEDRNKRCRRTMEDAHSFHYNFGGVDGAGFFAIFDGHAGKAAADWCGNNLHQVLETVLAENPAMPVPEALHKTFLLTDEKLAERKGLHSGCTAVVSLLRTETRPTSGDSAPAPKRVLYTGNVGDARVVLCRGGKAIRLTYDHKGSDPTEQQRISDSGGFIMNNRVNGILAVTRSLGDLSMKEVIVGAPYTTEVELTEEDEFFILACDGVWDVCSDDTAVRMLRRMASPQDAAEFLLQYALENWSTDNLSVLVVRLRPLKGAA